MVDAVNKGFRQVTGDVVGIQSSDDTYLPGAVRSAVDAFRCNAALGLVYGDTVKVDAQGAELSRHAIGGFSIENFLLFRTWIPQPSTFFSPRDVRGLW